MKTSTLIVLALALLASLVLIGALVDGKGEPNEPPAAATSAPAAGPSFRLRVLVPRLARPFAGILPDRLMIEFDLTPGELGFDHKSPGAEAGRAGPTFLELRNAEGWDFSLETDSQGRIAEATRLVFPLGLGGNRVKLRCRPEKNEDEKKEEIGYLRTTAREGGGELDGRFLVRLGDCEHAESGEKVDWPASPLVIRGSFAGLPPTFAEVRGDRL